VDPSKLSPTEVTAFREALIHQIQLKTAKYGRLSTSWRATYIILGLLGIAGNIVTVALSSTNARAIFGGEGLSAVTQLIIAICTAVSTVAMGLNAQLRSEMNATYFNEARERYASLELLTFSSLSEAVDQYQVLNGTYDSSGVGVLMSVASLSKSIGGGGGGGSSVREMDVKKRYAYPVPQHFIDAKMREMNNQPTAVPATQDV
jgi:hypothetical protein